jgi:hypothetical protein
MSNEIGTMTDFLFNKAKTKEQPPGCSPSNSTNKSYIKANEYYNNDRDNLQMNDPSPGGGGVGNSNTMSYLSPSKRKRKDNQNLLVNFSSSGSGSCNTNNRNNFNKSNSITSETATMATSNEYNLDEFKRFYSLRDRRSDLSASSSQIKPNNYVHRSHQQQQQQQPKSSYQYRDKYNGNTVNNTNNNSNRSDLNYISGGDNYSSSSSDYRYVGFHQKSDVPTASAATTITTPVTSKSSLKRNTGLSTHSLCSCDADSEVSF